MRIDTHQHLVPTTYREILARYDISMPELPSGLEMPEWTPELAVEANADVGIDTAILSLFNPRMELAPERDKVVGSARDLNDYVAGVVEQHPDRFGMFGWLPMPFVDASVLEVARAYDELHVDGIVVLANQLGVYIGQPGQDALFEVLDDRKAVVFIHPAEIPGPAVAGIPTFAVDFCLDTTRAAYLLVRNNVIRRYPNIRWILSHAGGFVPYASHRISHIMFAEFGRSPLDTLDDLSSFYFDTALSASPAALPTLMSFAKPGHVLFGSDWPLVPTQAVKLFEANLENYFDDASDVLEGINHLNARRLFPRLGDSPPAAAPLPWKRRVRAEASRRAMRVIARRLSPNIELS